MSQDIRNRFIFTVILTALCAYAIAPIPGKPKVPVLSEAKMLLGIDLAGGAELRYRILYEPNTPNKEKTTAAATDIIRRRIEAKHLVKEPKINPAGDDQIVVQMAGIDQDTVKEYRKLIEETGKLVLYVVAPPEYQERFNKGEKISGFDDFPNEGKSDGSYGSRILVEQAPIIDGRNIIGSEARQELAIGGARWVTTFELDTDGARAFDEAARKLYHPPNSGRIAIVLDGVVKSSPQVQSAAFGGHGQITGANSEEEAKNLAIILKSGALPAPLGSWGPDGKTKQIRVPESQTFVGPTLGQDAIKRGLVASGLTVLVVSLFMVVYYRSSGVVAVISLVLNLIYLLAIMAFFGATMTLPGIAGVVLTIGMAVDANILIYERIREEQARGKTAIQAFEAGHDRAFVTIIDCHVTTLLAAMVLYYLGTGPVQGFAVTLTIGIVTTLFSVLFCGKILMKMILAGGLKEFKYLHFLNNPKIDFLRIAKGCVIGTSLAAVAGMVFFGIRGEKNFGIEFKGGTEVIFATNKPMRIEDVRSLILSVKKEGLPKYEGSSIQTVSEPEATRSGSSLEGGTARTFLMRTSSRDMAEVKSDLQEIFKHTLSHEPFEEMKPEDVPPNPRVYPPPAEGPAGAGWILYFKAEKVPNLDELKDKIAKSAEVKRLLLKGDPILEEMKGAPEGLKKVKLLLPKEDAERQGMRTRLQEALKSTLVAELAQTPFLAEGNIGAQVAGELRDRTIWALLTSWAGIIIYLAIRFEWRYGVAAVIALIHDALIAISFTSLAGALVPKSWGLSFDMNMTTLAAVLTIIGYSVNDTIVVFDRIRENLHLMKKQTFPEIINASVNQTLSRTILTSFTVWITCVVLYVVTATTGGGIAEFSFPLIIGVLVGTYSSVYVAAPIVLWWYKSQKPSTT